MAKKQLFDYVVDMTHHTTVTQRISIAAADKEEAEYLAACRWKAYPLTKKDDVTMTAKAGKIRFNTHTLP